MNLFSFFKRKETKPIRHYQPAMTVDAKGILSAPLLPDRPAKIAEELDQYIAEIGNERRN